MRRALPLLLLLAIGLAGCGDSGRSLLTKRDADRLLGQVDKVEAAMAVDPPLCGTARKAAESGATRARALPRRVDAALRQNLEDWFVHLDDEVRKTCLQSQKPQVTVTPEPSATPDKTRTPEPTKTPLQTPTPAPTETATPTPTATTNPGGVEPQGAPGVDGQR